MRTILVSGARRGIGASIARAQLAQGDRVSIGVRDGALPDWEASLDAETAARLHVATYDAADPQAARHWVAEARRAFGPIDAVIASAGILIAKSVIEAADDDLQAMFDVNVQAPRRLAQAAWDDLCAHGQGRVILLSSLSGKRVKSAAAGSYAVTKHATTALAHALRHAGYAQGVRATAFCPSFVATDMGRVMGDRPDAAMTQPEDIARVVSLLLSLPNEASVAEFAVNCQIEDQF